VPGFDDVRKGLLVDRQDVAELRLHDSDSTVCTGFPVINPVYYCRRSGLVRLIHSWMRIKRFVRFVRL